MSNDNPRMRPWITDGDKAAVMAVLDRGDLMSGREVKAFEEELAAYFGKRHAVCVSSGTAALECAFWIHGGANGDYSLHSHNFIAAVSAARGAGFSVSLNNSCTPAALLGVVPKMNEYRHMVVDASQAFGVKSIPGRVHCYSFNANKPVACVGGALVTDDGVVAAHARQYRNHGREGDSVMSDGRNLRMGEINAALGRSQLRRIDEILARRMQVAQWYDEITGQYIDDSRESWFLYPWPGQPALAKKHRSLADFRLFDTATQEDRETALLPIWPLMTQQDCEAVCKL